MELFAELSSIMRNDKLAAMEEVISITENMLRRLYE